MRGAALALAGLFALAAANTRRRRCIARRGNRRRAGLPEAERVAQGVVVLPGLQYKVSRAVPRTGRAAPQRRHHRALCGGASRRQGVRLLADNGAGIEVFPLQS